MLSLQLRFSDKWIVLQVSFAFVPACMRTRSKTHEVQAKKKATADNSCITSRKVIHEYIAEHMEPDPLSSGDIFQTIMYCTSKAKDMYPILHSIVSTLPHFVGDVNDSFAILTRNDYSLLDESGNEQFSNAYLRHLKTSLQSDENLHMYYVFYKRPTFPIGCFIVRSYKTCLNGEVNGAACEIVHIASRTCSVGHGNRIMSTIRLVAEYTVDDLCICYLFGQFLAAPFFRYTFDICTTARAFVLQSCIFVNNYTLWNDIEIRSMWWMKNK